MLSLPFVFFPLCNLNYLGLLFGSGRPSFHTNTMLLNATVLGDHVFYFLSGCLFFWGLETQMVYCFAMKDADVGRRILPR